MDHPCIGFNLHASVSRRASWERPAWDDLKCLHLQVSGPPFHLRRWQQPRFTTDRCGLSHPDLTKIPKTTFKRHGKRSAARPQGRKKQHEEAHNLAFADKYYKQLKHSSPSRDSFHLLRLSASALSPQAPRTQRANRPTRPRPRSRRPLHRHRHLSRLQPHRQILGQRQLPRPSGPSPNEACHWYALRYWKRRGASIYN